MTRAVRHVLIGFAAVLGLLAALVILPIAAGLVAGYLSAPKPAPRAVEVIRYVTAPSASQRTRNE